MANSQLIFHDDISVLGTGAHEVVVDLGDEFLEACIGEGGSATEVGFDAKIGPLSWYVDGGVGVLLVLVLADNGLQR